MSRRALLAWAGSVALAAAAGWLLRGPGDSGLSAVPAAAPASATVVQVQPGGLVTLRVEQRPLAWVLAQIALQTGRDVGAALPPQPEVASAASPAPWRATAAAAGAPDELPEAPPTCPAGFDPARLVELVQRPGDDEMRADVLLRARADGLALPESLLRTLVESGVHERLRVAALEAWLDQRAQGDPRSERALLESFLHVDGAQLQQLVRQRLDDLAEAERTEAPPAPGHGP